MLNHRVTLMHEAEVVDGAGERTHNWTDVATIWSDVRFQTGAEVLRAGSEIAVKRASIRIRARADVDASWRLRYQGVEFDIKSAMPDVDRQFMFLVCEATK